MARDSGTTGGLRVGIAGLGDFGVLLGEQFRPLEDASIVALCDVSESARTAAGEQLDVPPEAQFETVEEMLATASLDAVVIATPNGLHYQQTMAALDRDLHVLCEKPIATGVEDAVTLTERVEQSDQTVMLGYQRHLSPAFVRGRERWAEGDAEPTVVTGELTHDWREIFETGGHWRLDPELSGGGHLINVGIHVLEAILWMTGLTPRHVTGTMTFQDEAQRIDTQSSLTIEFGTGTIATVSDTGLAPATREHVHGWDDDGALYIEGERWAERRSYTIEADGSQQEPEQSPSQEKAAAFLEAIETASEPASTARDATWALAVTLGAYEAARRNSRVTLTEQYPILADFER